jgi:hypothetical protein
MGLPTTSIPLGTGLQYLEGGVLAVDPSPTFKWLNTHTFTVPIIFAPNQSFQARTLFANGQDNGSVLYYDGQGWVASPAGNGVLIRYGQNVKWGAVDLGMVATGTLSPANGGTGIQKYSLGYLLVGNNAGGLSILERGSVGTVLTVDESGQLIWQNPTGLSGQGNAGQVSVWNVSNRLSSVPLSISAHQNTISISAQSSVLNMDVSGYPILSATSSSLTLTGTSACSLVLSNSGMSLILVNSRIDFGQDGTIQGASIPVSSLTGVLPITAGGTGINSFKSGDMLIGTGDGRLTRLPIKDVSDGCVLTVSAGSPTWQMPSGSVTPSAVAAGISAKPLVLTPVPSTIEFDGNRIYMTSSEGTRTGVSLLSDNIDGTSQTIRDVLPVDKGGLGCDVSENLGAGCSLWALSPTNFVTVQPGTPGMVLVSTGAGLPKWQYVVSSINTSDGMTSSFVNGVCWLSLDSTRNFNPQWAGYHRFEGGLSATGRVEIAGTNAGLVLGASSVSDSLDGELWYDGKDLNFRTQSSTIKLTETDAVLDKPSLYLPLALRADPFDEFINDWNIYVPFDLSDGQTLVKWAIRRVDFVCADTGNDIPSLILTVDGIDLSEPLTVTKSGKQICASTSKFTQAFVTSGQLIGFRPLTASGRGWTIYVTMEMI